MLDKNYQYINNLVHRVKEDDADALEELNRFYQPLLAACVRRLLVREPRLKKHREDVEAEACMALHQLTQSYDPALSYFSYYLSTRIDHATLIRCRRYILALKSSGAGIEEISFSEMDADWEAQYNDDPFGHISLRQSINNAIEHLSARQRSAVELYFFRNLTQQEAAAELGITQASFCKRLQRALSRMKEILSEEM